MNFFNRILFSSFKKSGSTTIWLLRIILPISLLVRFLDYFGALAFMARFLDPVFLHLGLPGSTAIIFITSIFLPLYAPLAIIMSMAVTLRELTILALMCQIAHNLPVESAIQAKTGTSFWAMSILRVVTGLVTGLVLNLILPKEMGMPVFAQTQVETITSVPGLLAVWLKGSLQIGLLILGIVFVLNVLYKMLLHYKLIDKLSRSISLILRFFGLPESTAFLWLIGYIVGLAYGGALMIDQMNDGKVTRSDAQLLNYHLAVSHSVIEDNLLFVALGVSVWWILGVRLTVAWLVVWVRRLFVKRGILLLLLTGVFVSCKTQGLSLNQGGTVQNHYYTSIPFEWIDGKTYRFMCDTVSSVGSNTIGLHGNAENALHYKLLFQLIYINNAAFTNVLSVTTSGENSNIGSEILKYGNVTLDYKNKTFNFEPFSNEDSDMYKPAFPIDITLEGNQPRKKIATNQFVTRKK